MPGVWEFERRRRPRGAGGVRRRDPQRHRRPRWRDRGADFELPTGSNIHRFGVAATDADGVELQVRFLEGGDVAMTLFVAFDNR